MTSSVFPAGPFPPAVYPPAVYPGSGAYSAPGASAFGPFPPGAFPASAFPNSAFPGTSASAPSASPSGPFPGSVFPPAVFPSAAFPATGVAPQIGLPDGMVEAAIAWLNADDSIASAFNWIGSDEAPPQSRASSAPVYPYLVLTEVSEVPDWDSGGYYTGRYEFQVAAVARGKYAARSAARLVRGSLNDAPLAFSDGPLLYLRHSGFVSTKDPDQGVGNADVWRCVVTFSALTAEAIGDA